MGEKTAIAWCDHTFNPVIGCMKVSAGCDSCFAEALMDTRYGRVEWGQRKTETTEPSVGTRVKTSATNWKQPLRWNRKALEAGVRRRVFCASLSDVFDNQWDKAWRRELFELVEATPALDWLLLTKRPENIEVMLGAWGHRIPNNVWLGTTAEDQAAYDKRWPILAQFNARVRFISYEPAIGSLKIEGHKDRPDWLIAGGETGPGHRWAKSEWFYSIRHQCDQAFVPFFMKQMWGRNPIPDDLMVRQFPPGAS